VDENESSGLLNFGLYNLLTVLYTMVFMNNIHELGYPSCYCHVSFCYFELVLHNFYILIKIHYRWKLAESVLIIFTTSFILMQLYFGRTVSQSVK
jgi:hypothetical protein